MINENGLFYRLPAEHYFAAKRINNSGLKLLLKSPLHYKTSLEIPQEETKAMLIGTAVHAATLEPDDFFDRYVVMPDIDGRTKEGKAEKAELESSGKIVLPKADFQLVDAVKNSVRTHATASKLLDTGNAEVTVFSEIDGIPAKCRMDWHRTGIIADLKTTDDASPSGFSRSVATYGYDIQAAWYQDVCAAAGIEVSAFVFIAVEKSAPYAVAIYELDADSIEVGRAKYQRALSLYKHCLATDEWPGYDTSIQSLSLPSWATREAA